MRLISRSSDLISKVSSQSQMRPNPNRQELIESLHFERSSNKSGCTYATIAIKLLIQTTRAQASVCCLVFTYHIDPQEWPLGLLFASPVLAMCRLHAGQFRIYLNRFVPSPNFSGTTIFVGNGSARLYTGRPLRYFGDRLRGKLAYVPIYISYVNHAQNTALGPVLIKN